MRSILSILVLPTVFLLGILSVFRVPAILQAAPTGTLTLTVAVDDNVDSRLSAAEIANNPLVGITVNIYDADDATDTACASGVTDAAGQVVFVPADTVNCIGTEIRYEVQTADFPAGIVVGPVNLEDDDADPTTSTFRDAADDTGPAVQILDLVADISLNIAAINPASYRCAPEEAYAMTNCFIGGNPTDPTSETFNTDAIVGFPYTSTGSAFPVGGLNVVEPDHLVTTGQVGSTWGLAKSVQTGQLYASTFLKRHVGLGPLGLDGIYQIDISDPTSTTVTAWLEIEDDLGIDVGQTSIPGNIDRGLTNTLGLPSYDEDVYSLIATVGLGDIDIVTDEGLDPAGVDADNWVDREFLFVTDLNNKDIHVIDTADQSLLLTYDIPAPTTACTNGEHRPWAVKYVDGNLFVGLVCDGSTDTANIDNLAGSPTLEAIVYQYNLVPDLGGATLATTPTATPTEILRFPLDYTRGAVLNVNLCDTRSNWHPWRATAPPVFPGQPGDNIVLCWPTPILSDIEFSDDGNMLLAFTDRTSHQWGFFDFGIDTTSDDLYQAMSSGDILIACPDQNGDWAIENNGTCGPLSAAQTSPEGPGGAEFFWADDFSDPGFGDVHLETANGGAAVLPGTNEVVVAGMDPFNNPFNSAGGINWFNTTDGTPRDPGYMLYASANPGTGGAPTTIPGTFGKSGGLGDVELFCPLIPLNIGDYVWVDADGDGVQDPGELPIAGATVTLTLPNGEQITTTTDANGHYNFDVERNQTYTIAIDPNTATNVDGTVLSPTTQNSGTSTDINDSDADGNGIITVTTGKDGSSDHTLDAGFVATLSLGNLVWFDDNDNGIVDGTEAPVGAGVVVNLLDSNGDPVLDPVTGQPLTTTTDANGNYLFEGLLPGDYIVQIAPENFQPGGPLEFYIPSTPVTDPDNDIDNDNNGNQDADPATNGIVSDPVTLNFGSEPVDDGDTDPNSNLSVDFGFYQPPLSLGNLVWFDDNNNGLVDGTETPVGAGVIVNLLDSNGDPVLDPVSGQPLTTTTDANGNYLFEDLLPGDYIVQIAPENFQAGGVLEGYNPSTPVSDPDNDIDNDNNGNQDADAATNGIVSDPVTLDYNSEPIDDGDTDPNSNLSVDFGFVQPTLSLGNLVWLDENNNGIVDGNEVPVGAGVVVNLLDSNGDPVIDPLTGQPMTTTTDANGNYLFENLPPGDYIVQIAPENFQPGGLLENLFPSTPVSDPDDDIDNDNNGNQDPDPATNGIVSDPVTLISDTEPTDDGDNDPNSNLSVDFGFHEPSLSLGNLVWFDDNNNGIVDGGETPVGEGVIVNLLDSDGNPVIDPLTGEPMTTTTDANGNYLFENLPPGDYIVQIAPENFQPGGVLEGNLPSTPVSDPDDDVDNDNNGNQAVDPANSGILSDPVTLTVDGEPTDDGDTDPDTNLTVDFGFLRPIMSLGNLVWFDDNDNGIVDGLEIPVGSGVVLYLLDGNGDPIIDPATNEPISTVTDANGNYLFTGLFPGDYIVLVGPENFQTGGPLVNYIGSTGTVDPDDDTDNDDNGSDPADPTVAGVESAPVTLELDSEPVNDGDADPNSNLTVDFGFYPVGPILALGNLIWFDENNNGLVDGNETPVGEGVIINLLDGNGNPVIDPTTGEPMTTTTDANGNYIFENLPPGEYIVQIAPENFQEGGVLEGFTGSTVTNTTEDTDNNDNGLDGATPSISGILSAPVVLEAFNEPIDDTDNDNNTNLTIDFGIIIDAAKAVELTSFEATWIGNGQIKVTWTNAVEINNFGFKLYRATVEDFNQAVEIDFISSEIGTGYDTSYEYFDEVIGSHAEGLTYWYWLVDVDTNGLEGLHGPVEAEVVDSASQVELGFKLMIPFASNK